jgi:apolipoprotein D and lipocalin family protein
MNTRPFLAACAVAASLGTALPLFAQSAAPTEPVPLASVPALDLQRYAGRWFEVALIPNFFQRQCASHTTAEYTPRPDGTVTVLNSCRKAPEASAQGQGGNDQKGERISATGVARLAEPGNPQAAARLQVRFAPDWLAWLPLVWANYWVVALDADYRWAIVSEPRREYLWVLSRTPTLDATTDAALMRRVAELGVDPAKLQRTRQTPP